MMEKLQKIHNLIILDESGSMESIKKSIISGFNGVGQKILHFIDPISKLEEIDDSRYRPEASTPLYDAMGYSFAKLKKGLENETDYNVLVTILTDGKENASKEYSGKAIKELIEKLKLESWTFTYIGTDHDVEKFAASISIHNTIQFNRNAEGMENMFKKGKFSSKKV